MRRARELLLLWVIKFEWRKVKEACLITCYDSLNSSPSSDVVLVVGVLFCDSQRVKNMQMSFFTFLKEDEFHYVYKADDSTVF